MDLRTTYMGMELSNPLVASSSPLTYSLEGIKRLADAGPGAIVMHSLFEEQLAMESHALNHYLTHGTESYAEATSYFPEAESYRIGPDVYLDLIRQGKEATGLPIIGSLNGVSTGGWISYARQIQDAGADALELNIYYLPTEEQISSTEIEQIYVDVLTDVKKSVTIPVAMKLSPYFSSVAWMARRLSESGADALSLFNRFYQPDLDLEALDVVPSLQLSTSEEMRLPLRWVAILHGRVGCDLALTTGVHTAQDALKGLMAGANVVMMCSELLQNGPQRIAEVRDEMAAWLEEHEYDSARQCIGSMSQKHVAEPAAFARANYLKVLKSYPVMI